MPSASLGVTEHEALPLALVTPTHDSVALSERVTDSPAMGAEVSELVSTPDTVVATLKSPVDELMVKVVGTGGGGLTVITAVTLVAR